MANSNARHPDVVEGAAPPERADDPDLAVPPENRAGHHPDREQDKPDPDAMAEAYGIDGPSEEAERSGRTTWLVVGGIVVAVVGGGVIFRVMRRRRRRRGFAAVLHRLPVERFAEIDRMRHQLPGIDDVRGHLPSASDVRGHLPSASDVRGHLPSTDELRSRLASSSAVIDRLPDASDVLDRFGRRRRSRLPFRR